MQPGSCYQLVTINHQEHFSKVPMDNHTQAFRAIFSINDISKLLRVTMPSKSLKVYKGQFFNLTVGLRCSGFTNLEIEAVDIFQLLESSVVRWKHGHPDIWFSDANSIAFRLKLGPLYTQTYLVFRLWEQRDGGKVVKLCKKCEKKSKSCFSGHCVAFRKDSIDFSFKINELSSHVHETRSLCPMFIGVEIVDLNAEANPRFIEKVPVVVVTSHARKRNATGEIKSGDCV